MDKGTAVGDKAWAGAVAGGKGLWRGPKEGADKAGKAADAQRERKAEAAAGVLEAQHKAEFASRSRDRSAAAAKAGGGKEMSAGEKMRAKHAKDIRATNTFGLSEEAADVIRQPEPEPEPVTAAALGAKLGGLFGGGAKKAAPSERDQLVALAAEIGWDEDILEAAIDGFDGDLAQTRAVLESQKA